VDLASALVAVALSLGGPYGDREPANYRAARVERIAYAIADASHRSDWPGTPTELAAASLTKAWFESWRFSLWVHRSGPRKDVGGYAISLWSLHSWRLVPYREWRTLGGLDGTERSAVAAARVLTFARIRCGANRADWVSATFSLYATGKRCRWSSVGPRVTVYRKIHRALQDAQKLTPVSKT